MSSKEFKKKMKRKREDEDDRKSKRRKFNRIKNDIEKLKSVKLIVNNLKEQIKEVEDNIDECINIRKLKLRKCCSCCFTKFDLVKTQCECEQSICNKCLNDMTIREDKYMKHLICKKCNSNYFKVYINVDRLEKKMSLLQMCFFE